MPRIYLGQLEVLPGQPRRNLQKATTYWKDARDQGADLLVLPEMALPGYLLGDLWERPAFLKECLDAQGELIALSREGPAIAFGGLHVDPDTLGEDGRPRKAIAFFLAQHGRLVPPKKGHLPTSIKTLMPNYREFDDSRHFTDTRKIAAERGCPLEDLLSVHVLDLKGRPFRIAGILCEDGWSENANVDPMGHLASQNPHLFINLSSSPYTRGKTTKRESLFREQSRRWHTPLLYCNAVGLQNNGKSVYTFDGDSALYDQGHCLHRWSHFKAEGSCVELHKGDTRDLPARQENTAMLHAALCFGTRAFLESTGIEKVVIGASGGIDSALAAAVYGSILPGDRLALVNMPSRFNTATTKGAARGLADALGCLYGVVDIEDSVALTRRQIDGLELKGGTHQRRLELSSFAMENVQARDRSGRILAALSAAFGGAFTCNANKTETCVGYSTLYGDHAGFFANLADLWKGQVYDLARYINADAGEAIVPQETINVLPSAELSEAQNPEAGHGDPLCYPYHDALFRTWVEDWNRKSPEDALEAWLEGKLAQHLSIDPKVIPQAFSNANTFITDLERWWRCYSGMGVAKRIQAPPVLALSRRAFGFDHREAQLAILQTHRYETLKARALAQPS